jgi:hypothetical protein
MTFFTNNSAHAPHRGRSRTMGRRYGSCELLEGRQLLSAMLQPGGWVSFLPSSAPSGWQPRWIDIASSVETPGAQVQAFSDSAGAIPGANMQFVSGGTQIQSLSGGGQSLVVNSANNGATATASSTAQPPEAVEVSPAGAPTQVVSGGSAGSTAGLIFTSPPPGAQPVGLNAVASDDQGMLVSSTNNGATATQSWTTLPQGPVVIGQGNAPIEIVSGGSAGSTAGPIVTSSTLSAPPADLNVEYGPGQGLFVSRTNNGATATVSSAAPLVAAVEVGSAGSPMQIASGGAAGPIAAGLPVINALEDPYVMPGFDQGFLVSRASDGATATAASTALPQGAAVFGPDGAPVETMSSSIGSTAVSTVATSSTGASTGSVEVGTNGAPMQVVIGNGSQSGSSASTSGSSTSSSSI